MNTMKIKVSGSASVTVNFYGFVLVNEDDVIEDVIEKYIKDRDLDIEDLSVDCINDYSAIESFETTWED